MRQYCQTAIEKELTKDEAQGLPALPFGEEALDRLEALQSKIFRGRTLSGDSAELIREARAGRMATVSGVVVIDASVAVKWLVREVHSDKAYALARSWAREEVYPMAPYLMPVEVANALYKRVMRKEISLAGGHFIAGRTLLDED